jgi:diazepam-binding inhibitor (GABA receptor modulating acyl-CoA-binding protein)
MTQPTSTQLSTAFEQAQQDVQTLAAKPGNDVMLQLYALYKQGTLGDATGERPGGFNFVAAAKYDAWKAVAGQSQAEAQAGYVALVKQLKGQGSSRN